MLTLFLTLFWFVYFYCFFPQIVLCGCFFRGKPQRLFPSFQNMLSFSILNFLRFCERPVYKEVFYFVFLSVKGLLLACDYSLALLIPARWCTDGRVYGFVHTEKILPLKTHLLVVVLPGWRCCGVPATSVFCLRSGHEKGGACPLVPGAFCEAPCGCPFPWQCPGPEEQMAAHVCFGEGEMVCSLGVML